MSENTKMLLWASVCITPILLKLSGHIDVSWWVVLIPTIVLSLLYLLLVILAVGFVAGAVILSKPRKLKR